MTGPWTLLARLLLAGELACALSCASDNVASAAEPKAGPEARAAEFLSREVPTWFRENRCYSCHNNGDAARALLAAIDARVVTDRQPLVDTLAFLSRPDAWDHNGPEGPFKDKRLARLQFAAALVEAERTRSLGERRPLLQAAALVAELQAADGSWSFEAAGHVGSSITYGPALATWTALGVLQAADAKKYADQIARARTWFRTQRVTSVLSAAATLWALAHQADDAGCASHEQVNTQRRACREMIAQGQSSAGGWGPFVNSPPEVFDSAVVLLALVQQPAEKQRDAWIEQGRKYLLAAQRDDGSWPATTRPSGAESYAQQVSTTAWALRALLATSGKPREGQ